MNILSNILNWLSKSNTSSQNEKWKVVVLCLVTATTFWFLNALNKDNYTTKINYPIQLKFENSSDSLVTVASPPEKLSLDVSGRGWNLFRKTFWFNFNPIVIDLKSPADVKFLTKDDLQPIADDQLADLKVNYVIDDTIFFNVERKKTRKVLVHVHEESISTESDFHVISSVNIVPDSVMIEGHSSFIEQLSDTLVLKIDDNDIDQDFDDRISTNIFNNDIVKVHPENVDISFEVDEFKQRTISSAFEMMNFPQDSTLNLSDTLININFKIGDRLLNQLDEREFRILADFKNLNPIDSILPLKMIQVPDIVRDVTLQPDTIKIMYGKIP
ncbi:hypothetical protein QQ008_05040 [Fulvivirgaceae bacterium BMA10]|uniref:YbbR-like domain-containing protein n=1 Tax=Splendidivirga corallicola TaxID=3051826 RepID=A0ABT8KJ14_9BACT|nr:hypothetical protein [Fulvivirgaceae bacterium BMA10]